MDPFEIGAGIGGGIMALFGGDSNAKEQERAFKYNEKAADNADTRQRNLYTDLYSPMALMKQYDAAGISKGLAMSKGGTILKLLVTVLTAVASTLGIQQL